MLHFKYIFKRTCHDLFSDFEWLTFGSTYEMLLMNQGDYHQDRALSWLNKFTGAACTCVYVSPEEEKKIILMPLYSYFVVTLAIELPFIVIYFRKDWKTALLIGSLLNLFTWPLLHLFLFNTNININLLELMVACVEAVGYFLFMECKWWHALLLSFFVNGLSYGVGLLITQN